MWSLLSPIAIGALVIGLMAIMASKQFETAIGGRHPAAARWTALALSVLGGLLVAVFMIPLLRIVTSLGTLGVLPAAIGAVFTVLIGWNAVYLIIAGAKEITGKKPGDESRKAARWVPSFLPIGGATVITMLAHPQAHGFGLAVNTVTAAIVSAITMGYTFKIFNFVHGGGRGGMAGAAATGGGRDLGGSGGGAGGMSRGGKGRAAGWNWVTTVIAFLAGFIHIALINYADAVAADHIPGGWMTAIRLAGAGGVFLMLCGAVDLLRDHIPDGYVRRAGVFGVPLVTLFGSLAVSFVSDHANSTIQLLSSGGMG
jgi:hypothetical protein